MLLLIWLLQKASISILLYSLPVVALSLAGNAGINLTFGILGANMNWEDPRRMQGGGSSCLGGLATMLYLPLGMLLFFAPPILAEVAEVPAILGQLAGLAIGGAFSLLCAVLPLWAVSKRVARLGEA